MYRAKVARAAYRKRFKARQVIQTHLYKYMKRRQWERELESYASKFIEIVVRIQKEFRWRKRWGMILDYVMRRKSCAIRIQKAFRRRRLHMLIKSMIDLRMAKRIFLQRAFRFYTMRQFTIREVNRRIEAKKRLVEDVELRAEQKLKAHVEEMEGKVVLLNHELKQSRDRTEELNTHNERLQQEIASLKLSLANGTSLRHDHQMAKGTI